MSTASPLALRPWELADAESLFAAALESIPTVFPWLPWCHPGYRIEESREWLERQVAAFAEGREYHFALLSGDGQILGGCGLNRIDPAYRLANLGYWVRSSATGRGVATAAVHLLADWAFRETELHRLEILVVPDNSRSLRVAEKAGAVREGILRSRLWMHDKPHDTVVFSIVRGDRAL